MKLKSAMLIPAFAGALLMLVLLSSATSNLEQLGSGAAMLNPLEDNTDRPGMDIRSFDMANPLPDQCAQACYDDPQCKAFTYVKPGFQGPSARCYLKNGIPDPLPRECCMSGVKGEEARTSAEGQIVAGVIVGAVNIPPQITPSPEGTGITTPGIQARIPGTLERSLTGIWECSDGGLYYLRQSGSLVAWFAQSRDEYDSWAQVGWGDVQADLLKITWMDVPLRERQQQGYLQIGVDDSKETMVTLSNVTPAVTPAKRWVRFNGSAAMLKGPATVLQPELLCPGGCECLNRNTALERFEYPQRCLKDPCGTAPDGELKYCFQAGEIPSTPIPEGCPSGCRCMLEEQAASLGATERCSETVCGYSEDRMPMYCFDLRNMAS